MFYVGLVLYEAYNSGLGILAVVRLFGLFMCHLCFVGKDVDIVLQVHIFFQ